MAINMVRSVVGVSRMGLGKWAAVSAAGLTTGAPVRAVGSKTCVDPLALLGEGSEGSEGSVTPDGGDLTTSFAVYHRGGQGDAHSGPGSYWHTPQLYPTSATSAASTCAVVNMVNEIPKGAVAKLEINTKVPGTPIVPDTGADGALRTLAYGGAGIPFNYGAIPRTWEDVEAHLEGGLAGDNDPLDVVELSGLPLPIGAVVPVRVLGVLGLVDEGEIDYKIVALREPLAAAAGYTDAAQLPAATAAAIAHWFVHYKTADGKPTNELLWDGSIRGAAHAKEVIAAAAASYDALCGNPARAAALGHVLA